MSHCKQTEAELRRERAAIIARQNDQFRRQPYTGKAVMTVGVSALLGEDPQQMVRLLNQIAEYSDFTPDNDPHSEHDLGRFEFRGQQLLWKIDYYDNNWEFHSPDPMDPLVTQRVLTVMLTEEY